MQISVNAEAHQTILIRVIAGAYSLVKLKLPVDAVIISFDGRALGILPVNRAFHFPAGETITLGTARRVEFLIRSETPVNDFAEVEYLNHRDRSLIFTGKIPVKIGPGGKG